MAAVVLTTACGSGPAPAYVRLGGPAPRLADVPASRALLVVFWASWCAPCRTETPSLRRLSDRRPEGLELVVFGHDDSPAAVREFLAGDPPAAWHYRADTGHAVATSFGVDALPASILVVQGRLKARFSGSRDWGSDEMHALLDRLIQEDEGHLSPTPAGRSPND